MNCGTIGMVDEWIKARRVRRNCYLECLLVILTGFVYGCCPSYGKNKKAYAYALVDWQKRFNEECLDRLKIQVKLRSHGFRMARAEHPKPLNIMHTLTRLRTHPSAA